MQGTAFDTSIDIRVSACGKTIPTNSDRKYCGIEEIRLSGENKVRNLFGRWKSAQSSFPIGEGDRVGWEN